jgi:hypothetical protein
MLKSCGVNKILIRISRDSSVGIATDYGLGSRGSIPSRGKTFVSAPQSSERPWGRNSFLSSEYRGYFPGNKATGTKADQSYPSRTEVKNGTAITSTPP